MMHLDFRRNTVARGTNYFISRQLFILHVKMCVFKGKQDRESVVSGQNSKLNTLCFPLALSVSYTVELIENCFLYCAMRLHFFLQYMQYCCIKSFLKVILIQSELG